MKLITLISATFLLMLDANAATTYDTCFQWSGCVATVTVDSGTAKTGISTGCDCESYSGGDCPVYVTAVANSCMSGYNSVGLSVTGTQRCCAHRYMCLGTQGATDQEKLVKSANADLASVMDVNVEGYQTSVYWGYYGTSNRSPNLGRGNSTLAKLDVCLGGTDTDTALASQSVSTCQSYCGSTNYNDYCSANSSAVCNDRCECALNDPNCNYL